MFLQQFNDVYLKIMRLITSFVSAMVRKNISKNLQTIILNMAWMQNLLKFCLLVQKDTFHSSLIIDITWPSGYPSEVLTRCCFLTSSLNCADDVIWSSNNSNSLLHHNTSSKRMFSYLLLLFVSQLTNVHKSQREKVVSMLSNELREIEFVTGVDSSRLQRSSITTEALRETGFNSR